MRKFNKLVLYDLKSKPLEKEFITQLKKYAKEIKFIFADAEYQRSLKLSDLDDADALITRIFDHYDKSIFAKSNLKYIGTMHTDKSHFNPKTIGAKKITLTNVPGYATEAVAELTFSALLNITRQTTDATNFVKSGKWGFQGFLGTELKGKTLGIIGLGKIGLRVAELADAFEMNIIYYSKTKHTNVKYKFVDLKKLLKQSDVITLHCKFNNETKNIINKGNIKLLKDNAILLNSSRMELVDLQAVYDMCKKKKLYAWFDELQDVNWRKKFNELNNVYLTPDFGWMTKEAQQRVRDITLYNIKDYLSKP